MKYHILKEENIEDICIKCNKKISQYKKKIYEKKEYYIYKCDCGYETIKKI